MFPWGRHQRRAGQEPDPSLAPLPKRTADQLRSELEQALGERGATISFEGDHALVSHPTRGWIGLGLADAAHDIAASQHPKAVQQIAKRLVDGLTKRPGLSEMDAAELYSELRLRVAPTGGVGEQPDPVTAAATLSQFTEDTVVTLVIESGYNTAMVAPRDQLAELDDVDSLVRAGRANIRTELLASNVQAQLHATVDEHPGARFWSFESDSEHMGSAALLLEEVLAAWAPRFDVSNGILFSMPSRNILLARSVTEGEDLVEGLTALAPAAVEAATRSDRPVSELLHLYHLGEIITISEWDAENRHLRITPNDYLQHLMQEQ